VAAQLLLKHGMSNISLPESWFSWDTAIILTNKFVIFGLFCYGLSMVFWLYILTKVEVSRAYPFVGLGFIGTMFFAYLFLQEPLTLPKLIGTICIVLGVFLIARY
jgi:drug/metabolite transporter (DMT)-like permease